MINDFLGFIRMNVTIIKFLFKLWNRIIFKSENLYWIKTNLFFIFNSVLFLGTCFYGSERNTTCGVSKPSLTTRTLQYIKNYHINVADITLMTPRSEWRTMPSVARMTNYNMPLAKPCLNYTIYLVLNTKDGESYPYDPLNITNGKDVSS